MFFVLKMSRSLSRLVKTFDLFCETLVVNVHHAAYLLDHTERKTWVVGNKADHESFDRQNHQEPFIKLIAAALVLLSSANVLAANDDSSWSAIFADDTLTVSQPPPAATFGANGFFNTCVDGDQLRSLTGTLVCEKWVVTRSSYGGQDAGPSDYSCASQVLKFTTLPLTQTQVICAKQEYVGGGKDAGSGSCLGLKTISYKLSTNPVLSVFNKRTSGGQDNPDDSTIAFVKSYQIPNCKVIAPPRAPKSN